MCTFLASTRYHSDRWDQCSPAGLSHTTMGRQCWCVADWGGGSFTSGRMRDEPESPCLGTQCSIHLLKFYYEYLCQRYHALVKTKQHARTVLILFAEHCGKTYHVTHQLPLLSSQPQTCVFKLKVLTWGTRKSLSHLHLWQGWHLGGLLKMA